MLSDVASNLQIVEAIQNVKPNWPPLDETTGEEVVTEGLVAEEADILKVGAGGSVIMPDNDVPDPPVDFDQEDKKDGDKAAELARSIKVEFNAADIKFWFAELEDEMLVATVNSQWLKKSVLQRNLPVKQKEDVKAYLTLPKSEAGNKIYYDIKQSLVRIYAPRPQDSYAKSLSRTMTGLPSQLGYQIIDDICKKPQKLVGCCCGV